MRMVKIVLNNTRYRAICPIVARLATFHKLITSLGHPLLILLLVRQRLDVDRFQVLLSFFLSFLMLG